MEEALNIEKKKEITGTGLKIIALVAMFIDHFAAIVLNDYLTVTVPGLSGQELMEWFQKNRNVAAVYMIMVAMRMIGRFGFPLFAFLIVEGFQHTRNVVHYAGSLGAFALISELPFNLGFDSTLFCPSYQNVFFTLLMGLLTLAVSKYLTDHKREEKRLVFLFYLASFLLGPFVIGISGMNFWPVYKVYNWLKAEGALFWIVMGCAGLIFLALFAVLGRKWEIEKKNSFAFFVLSLIVFALTAEFLRTDYGGGGVLVIALMYLLRKKRKAEFSVGCLILTLMSPSEAMAFFMLIPIAKYNGERGMKLNKYFFYAFYPVHIGLLYLAALLLNFTSFSVR